LLLLLLVLGPAVISCCHRCCWCCLCIPFCAAWPALPVLTRSTTLAFLQVGADLHFAGPANQRRGRADSISKILFQHLARTQPITLEQLTAAAAASAAAAAEAASAAAAAAAGSAGLLRAAAGSGGRAAAGLGDVMGSGDSGSLLAGGGGSASMLSELGTSSMAVEAGETDGIEVDS
jgi:snurportin-1